MQLCTCLRAWKNEAYNRCHFCRQFMCPSLKQFDFHCTAVLKLPAAWCIPHVHLSKPLWAISPFALAFRWDVKLIWVLYFPTSNTFEWVIIPESSEIRVYRYARKPVCWTTSGHGHMKHYATLSPIKENVILPVHKSSFENKHYIHKEMLLKKKTKTYFSGQTSSSTKVWNSRAFFLFFSI